VTKIKIQAAQFEHFSKRSINKQINTQSRNVFPNCNGSQTVCGQTRIALTLANKKKTWDRGNPRPIGFVQK
jgi:hypothetical protein